MSQLDVIVPVYNEVNSVDELVERLDKALTDVGVDYNIIFVDDYSTDNTTGRIRKYVPELVSYVNGETTLVNSYSKKIIYDAFRENGEFSNGSRVKLLHKRGKQGKAYSILEGARVSKAPYIAMIDGDLQYPPEALPEMYRLAQKHGVAVANRRMNGVSPLRKIGSKLNILVFERLLHGFNCDAQSGLKVFKREIIELLSEEDVTPWTLDIPLLITARELGYEIATYEINFSERKYGESKVNFVRTAAEIAQSAIKLKLKNGKAKKLKLQNGDPIIGAGVVYKGRRFITHSHLPVEQSAIETLVPWQKTALFTIAGATILGFLINSTASAIFVISLLSFVYFADLIFSFSVLLKSLRNPPEIKIRHKEIEKLRDEELPIYSILCPLYKEANILPQFLGAIDEISWPKEKLDVILLLEEDDKETIEAVKRANVPDYVLTLIVPESYPKTKPKACNYGLAHAKGKYIVIYDAEDKPDPFQLKKAYIAFSKLSAEVICLQSKLNYYNKNQNLLTRLFTSEYSLWFDLILPGLQSINTTIPLGGTSNHFKTFALRFLHGWDSFNVTEDCDLGARLFKAGFKTAIIDSVTLEEANSRMGSWIRQRSRWIKGYFQTFLVHMRDPLGFYKKYGLHSLIFSLVIGARMVFILINPVLWAGTVAYFAARASVGSVIESLYPAPIYYIATTSLVFGNFLYFYNFMIGVAKRRNWEIMKFVFFMPFYWMMTSVASLVALYQLAVKPHYWEKTEHGLVHKKPLKALPDFRVYFSFDFEFPVQIVKRTLTGLFWPIAVVVKNAIDFIGLIEPLESVDSLSDGKLRILIFNWRDTKHVWSGGAETYLHELSKRWVRQGHAVTLFCGWDGKSSRDEKVDRVKVIRRGGFYTVYFFGFLYYLLKLRGKFDVIVDSENGIPFFTPAFVGVPKILLIHHIHQEIFRRHLKFPFSKIAQFLESKLTPLLYKNISVVTPSDSSKKDIVRTGWREEMVDIVTPGIELSKFHKSKKTSYPSFVYLGRLKPYKNIDFAIRAFEKVYKKFPSAKFTIAGIGESLNSLKKLAKKLAITDSVIFTGFVSEKEKAELLSRSWCAIQPSSIEGWGITVIESNASGTPVIASDVRGLRDSVVDGRTGILFPVGDVEKLSDTMEGLIRNEFFRNYLSQEAYLWSQRFSWKPPVRKFEEILFRLVRSRIILRGVPEIARPKLKAG